MTHEIENEKNGNNPMERERNFEGNHEEADWNRLIYENLPQVPIRDKAPIVGRLVCERHKVDLAVRSTDMGYYIFRTALGLSVPVCCREIEFEDLDGNRQKLADYLSFNSEQ